MDRVNENRSTLTMQERADWRAALFCAVFSMRAVGDHIAADFLVQRAIRVRRAELES